MFIKNSILFVLLSAFVFIAFHDCIMVSIDSDTQVELCADKTQELSMCKISILHEQIHQSILDVSDLTFLQIFDDNRAWVLYMNNSFFASDFNHRLYRPPLA